MQLLQDVNIDWLSKKFYFIGLSVLLATLGIASMVSKGGVRYGIDFRGGTLLQVRFAEAPDLTRLRVGLAAEGLQGSTLQQFGDVSNREILVGLDVRTPVAGEALDAGKQAVEAAFGKLYGGEQSGKLDLNNTGAETVAEYLVTRDPLGTMAKGGESAVESYRELATAIMDFRNSSEQGGLVGSFEELDEVEGVNPSVTEALKADFYLSGFTIGKTEIVGPKIGAELQKQALQVVGWGLAFMLAYIWLRFQLIYGFAAVLAVFHDVIITVGLLSLFDVEFTLPVVTALLTLVGYSMNDTIVVFDRIRENLKVDRRMGLVPLINRSINQTLSRTLLTSGLTLLAVVSLYVLGGAVIHGFALTFLMGVLVGTYSSVSVASPVLLVAPGWVRGRGGAPERPRVYEGASAGSRR